MRAVDLMAGAEQALAVVGPDAALAQRVLARMVGTAVASCKGPVEVVLLEGQSTAVHDSLLGSLVSSLTNQATRVERVAQGDVARWCDTWQPDAVKGHKTILVPVALDAVADLSEPLPGSFDLPVEHLRDWVRTGATRGVFVIGWWQSRYQLEQHLGFGAPGVRGWALAGLGREDVQAVCGPMVSPPRRHPRILWYDRAGSNRPEPLVPFEAEMVG